MERNNNTSSGFLNGFLLGNIVGGVLVYLFGTKKGKKLLKVITEEGFDSISQLEELLSQREDSEEKRHGNTSKNHTIVPEVLENVSDIVKNGEKKAIEVVSQIKRPVRRFFRGIPKKN